METEIVGGSAVTKAAWLALLVGELQELIMDARWLILAVLVCIVADFRLGRGEAAKRYAEAEASGMMVRFSVKEKDGNDDPIFCVCRERCIGGGYISNEGKLSVIVAVPFDTTQVQEKYYFVNNL